MSYRPIRAGALYLLPALTVALLPGIANAQGERLSRSVVSGGAVSGAEPGGPRARATVGALAGVMTEFNGGSPVHEATLGFWARGLALATDMPGTVRVIPLRTELLPNSPNPFFSRTSVRFSLAHDGRVHIPVYDVTGRQVATVTDAWYAAGRHTVRFEPRGLASGVYFYRMQAGDAVETRRFLLLK